jgi:hypothetical protein
MAGTVCTRAATISLKSRVNAISSLQSLKPIRKWTAAMGAGKLLQQLGPDPDGWEAVPPDSIFSQRMGMACGK